MKREAVIDWLKNNGFKKTTRDCWNRGTACLSLSKLFCNYREGREWLEHDVIAEFNLLEDNALEQRDGWFRLLPKERQREDGQNN